MLQQSAWTNPAECLLSSSKLAGRFCCQVFKFPMCPNIFAFYHDIHTLSIISFRDFYFLWENKWLKIICYYECHIFSFFFSRNHTAVALYHLFSITHLSQGHTYHCVVGRETMLPKVYTERVVTLAVIA